MTVNLRNSLSHTSRFVYHPVDLVTRDTSLHHSRSCIQHLPANNTGCSDALNFLRSIHPNRCVASFVTDFTQRKTFGVVSVVRTGNAPGHRPACGLGGGAQGACEVVTLELPGDESGISFSFLTSLLDHFVQDFVGGPVILEALLAARGVRDTHTIKTDLALILPTEPRGRKTNLYRKEHHMRKRQV